MSVLIVDDHATNRKLLRAMLEAEGLKTFEAVDGVEALSILRSEPVDAIISDILMPRMDGYRLCLEVRRTEKFKATPFIVYTSTYTSPSDEKTALELGADRFLKKPASAGDVFQALREAANNPRPRATCVTRPEQELMKEYNEALVRKLEKKNFELEERSKELQATQEQLRALAAGLQDAREEERIRIAREIHDELGEVLTRIKFDLADMRYRLESGITDDMRQELLKKIAALGGLADGTAGRLRKICTELRPPVLDDMGLVPAIEWQASEFEKRTKIRCELSLEAPDLVVVDEQATMLFRVFQEMLTNVARHSQASKIRVRLKKSSTSLFLEVKDNGRGIETENLASTKSLGFLGMRERAALFGGELQVHGKRGKGTTVVATIPLTNLSNRKTDGTDATK
jgi:signal transduction histidine kinase